MRGPALLLLCLYCATAHPQAFPETRSEYLSLLDRDRDGRISESEYLAYMSRGFRSMDSNGDGILSTGELPGGRGRPLTWQDNQDNLRRQFHRLDRNRDGYLNARELTAPPG